MTKAVRSFISPCFLSSQEEEPLQMKMLEEFCHRPSAWAGTFIYSLDWGRKEAPADILDDFFPAVYVNCVTKGVDSFSSKY